MSDANLAVPITRSYGTPKRFIVWHRVVWCGRVRCVRDPFGCRPGGTPYEAPAPDPIEAPNGPVQPAGALASMGCDRPTPRRIGDTRYKIEPMMMIENTLIRRSTRTMVVASWVGNP